MIPADVHQTLTEIHQEHVLSWWDELSSEQKERLTRQIQAVNLGTFKTQQSLLERDKRLLSNYSSCKKAQTSGSDADIQRGKELLAAGKAGCLIMAGGMGTRLNCHGPKGVYPVTLTQKSLFQLVSEKAAAASRLYRQRLPVAIMTSPLNDGQTRDFFHAHNHFGLPVEQIDFFVQKDLPLLDEQGNLFLDAKWHIAEGPNGNGGCLTEFYRSGIWEKWKNQGIEYVNVILIDNPLADPFDAELIGSHDRHQSDLMVKVVKRSDPDEKVGVLVQAAGKIHVVEYSEIDQKDKKDLENFPFANLSLFSATMNFIEQTKDDELPLHKAFKAASYLDESGKVITPDSPNSWKFEMFIFDLFPHGLADIICYPRSECFAPLKNQTGKASPQTVLASLQEYDRMVYESISGLNAPDTPFELDTQFYYPTDELLKKWKGKPLPDREYITP